MLYLSTSAAAAGADAGAGSGSRSLAGSITRQVEQTCAVSGCAGAGAGGGGGGGGGAEGLGELSHEHVVSVGQGGWFVYTVIHFFFALSIPCLMEEKPKRAVGFFLKQWWWWWWNNERGETKN